MNEKDKDLYKGPIAWMARNSVAANLLMIALVVGGIMFAVQAKQEVFPEFDLDMISITVPYPGASPAEVEQGIVLAVEEAVRGLDDVDTVTSTAGEGFGSVTIELLRGANNNKVLQDVKNAVDRITSFPVESEDPSVSLLAGSNNVLSLILYGDIDEAELRKYTEKARNELLIDKNITLVEMKDVRPLEIKVEVPQEKLRAYNLTLSDVARQISSSAVELPAGGVKTKGGEILLRTMERRDYGLDFADIPILTNSDGTEVRLGDIATIVDGFSDTDLEAYFYDKRAARLDVYRVGDQTPVEVSRAVKAYIARTEDNLPPGLEMAIWSDGSEVLESRKGLLIRNASIGLLLVILFLGIFLKVKLAFWVTMGIPISILGSFLFFPVFDITINMISLFAFIITLGIVVDDAIIVGENIFDARERKMPSLKAAIYGARTVAIPVTFSILTNIAAFMPMFFLPGIMGKIFMVIPAIVIPVFAISWVESLFVLPAHLGHQKPPKPGGFMEFINRFQDMTTRMLSLFILKVYVPVMKLSLRNRYATLAIGIAMLMLTFGFVKGGHVKFIFMPKVEADWVIANAALPYGTSIDETKKVEKKLAGVIGEILEENGGEEITRGLYSVAGGLPFSFGRHSSGGSGSHITGVAAFLVSEDQRGIKASEIANQWRERLGEIPGLESLEFNYSTGPSGGADFALELSHTDINTLEAAAMELAGQLNSYSGLKDINDGFSAGKPQLDFVLKQEAQSLGITSYDLASQVRNSFYGAEALRQQRGRDEVKVMVRLPEDERQSEYNLEEMLIRTKGGGEIPLSEAATIIRGQSYTSINRENGKRVVTVVASIAEGSSSSAAKIMADLNSEFLPDLKSRYDGLSYEVAGQSRELQEALGPLWTGFGLAMIAIFAMLAIPFKSYFQPVIVMSAIPFGMVGALIGHLIMGYDLSLISLMGIVALSGVVVNDSLVLVDYTNRMRREGNNPFESIVKGGIRRFRPILLTSLTTFCGLAPMIFETSLQAKFLIPMAISLGFGVLFSTIITLILVPSFYLILEDIRFIFVGDPVDYSEVQEHGTSL